MARTIQSPGVEINEIDLTLRADTVVGTNVLITGFSNQGPIDEVLQPTSISEFEQIYGVPTNAAERYFYHSAKACLNSSPANVFVSRLPYGEAKGEGFASWRYSALVYPVTVKNLYQFTLSSFPVDSIYVANSGSGYTQLPAIYAFDANNDVHGTFLQAVTADDNSGNGTFGITQINVINKGTHETRPNIVFTPSSFAIQGVSLNNRGTGYLNKPNVILAGGGTFATPASVDVQMGDDGIGMYEITGSTILLANSGEGYPSSVTVEVVGDCVTPALFTPNLANDDLGTNTYGITSLNLIHAGYGYITAPTIRFVTLNGGDNASATVNGSQTITYSVTAVNLLASGLGYDSAPLVTLSGNHIGTDADIVVTGVDTTPLAFAVGTQSVKTFSTNTWSDGSLSGYGASDGLSEDIIDDVPGRLVYLGKTCFIGKPTHMELDAIEYDSILQGNINWSNFPTVSTQAFTYNTLGESAFIVLNKAQSSLNSKFEGYYVGAIDNSNNNPATDFNGILSINSLQKSIDSTKNYLTVPKERISFTLSADKFGSGSSVSEVMENLSNFDLANTSFDDCVSLGLFKIRQNVFTSDVISMDYILSESYVGSIDFHREINDQNGGPKKTFSLEKLTEGSPNFKILVNPNLSNRYSSSTLTINGAPSKKIRFLSTQLEYPIVAQGYNETEQKYINRVGALSGEIAQLNSIYGKSDALFPIGIYTNENFTNKVIGALPKKIERVFELVENADVFPIDIIPEAGLGTIYVNSIEQDPAHLSAGNYAEYTPLNALSALYITQFDGLENDGLRIRGNYTAISNVFVNFAEKQRKDLLVILDPLRNIFVQGDNTKIINTKKIFSPNAGIEPNLLAPGYVATNFSQHIYWPLRHQFGTTNSSYATTYANWVQILDSTQNRQVWVPFSGMAASIMANTDANFQPWYAPAGFTRGIVTGVNDLAIYPKQKQRDQLYKISLNPIAFFPNEGFVVFGQKTMLKKPSAFDRINVRRLFLNLEKATKNTAKFFVFEPNTLFTRTQVINILAPIFENAKNTEGLYDYRIVCSELNNTPDVIDNNELKIDIYIQPVRAAEFILVNFYATRTGTNFDELIGGK